MSGEDKSKQTALTASLGSLWILGRKNMNFLSTPFSLVRLPDLVWGACQNYNFRAVLYGRLAKKKKKRNWWEFRGFIVS